MGDLGYEKSWGWGKWSMKERKERKKEERVALQISVVDRNEDEKQQPKGLLELWMSGTRAREAVGKVVLWTLGKREELKSDGLGMVDGK